MVLFHFFAIRRKHAIERDKLIKARLCDRPNGIPLAVEKSRNIST